MSLESRAGRTVGVLILVQMVVSYLVNFVLAAPLFGSPGFLVAAAPHATQIAISVVMGLGLGTLLPGMAVVAFPAFRRCAGAAAIGFVALATATFAVAVVEQINVMSMVSLSQAYTAATDQAPFQALRGVVAASRNWSHFIVLLLSGCAYFVLYAILFRSALVPRLIAGLGMVAVLLQIGTVARPLFGQNVIFPLLAPLGLVQLVLAMWLIFRGFGESAPAAGPLVATSA